jgi:hypothetical protein
MATFRTLLTGTALVVTVALAPTLALGGGTRTDRSVLLRSPLVGSRASDPQLFGAVPGTVDEAVSRSRVVVRADGRLDARVRGLVQPREGSNPIPLLAASLVCSGHNVDTTAPVPFDEAGNADVHERLTVPPRCLAPAVLINPLDRDGVYIAATGRV